MSDKSEEHKCMTDSIDRLASRHIAKLLTRLGDTIAPVQASEIKRQFRYFADDAKQVNTGETSEKRTKQIDGNK